ncbi:MAG: biopolymer transporter ExbD [Pseudomonadota bacterium]
MSFGAFQREAPAPMAEINTTPLVDVMLVLLVVFIVTAPVLTHAVKVDLPKAASQRNQEKPEHIAVSLDGAGRIYWNGAPVDEAELPARLAQAAANPQVELQLRADRMTPYHRVAEILSATSRAGVSRVGFVTEPTRR